MTTSVNMGEMVKQLKQVLKNQKEVSIIGHDNIDVDSFLSGILLEKLLKFMGINARFMILEPIKYDDTYSVLKKIGINNMHDYYYPYEDESRILFLVDHYETSHKGRVIGCIDHHPTIKDNDYEFSYVRNATSAGFMVYELMKEAKYPFNLKDLTFVVTSMMIDTVSFRSSKAIHAEVEEAKKIARQYPIGYLYLEKVCLCLTEIDQMSIEGITTNGQKQYTFNGNNVKSAYVQLNRTPGREEVRAWINHIHKKVCNSTDLAMYVFLIFDTKLNYTDEYQIMRFHTKHVKHKGILSRGKDIMPLVEKRFTNTLDQEEMIQRIIEKMSKASQTIATMESCTGGSLAGAITDVSGASDILHESYVTYCNDAKIKQGVPASTIDTFTVYSKETAIDMAKAVKKKVGSSIGVGITGQLGRIDPRNVGVENNKAWYSIATDNKTITAEITLYSGEWKRSWKKEVIIEEIINDLYML